MADAIIDYCTPQNDSERRAIVEVLAILRAGYDRVETTLELDARRVSRFGAQFPHGVRDMGARFEVRGLCLYPRDAEAGECMEPSRFR